MPAPVGYGECMYIAAVQALAVRYEATLHIAVINDWLLTSL
jgi:hypothetical protein